MKIIISFEASNDSFTVDFDGEVKRILQQAEAFLLNERDSEFLKDINGNIVGNVFRSTILRPKR